MYTVTVIDKKGLGKEEIEFETIHDVSVWAQTYQASCFMVTKPNGEHSYFNWNENYTVLHRTIMDFNDFENLIG